MFGGPHRTGNPSLEAIAPPRGPPCPFLRWPHTSISISLMVQAEESCGLRLPPSPPLSCTSLKLPLHHYLPRALQELQNALLSDVFVMEWNLPRRNEGVSRDFFCACLGAACSSSFLPVAMQSAATSAGTATPRLSPAGTRTPAPPHQPTQPTPSTHSTRSLTPHHGCTHPAPTPSAHAPRHVAAGIHAPNTPVGATAAPPLLPP